MYVHCIKAHKSSIRKTNYLLIGVQLALTVKTLPGWRSVQITFHIADIILITIWFHDLCCQNLQIIYHGMKGLWKGRSKFGSKIEQASVVSSSFSTLQLPHPSWGRHFLSCVQRDSGLPMWKHTWECVNSWLPSASIEAKGGLIPERSKSPDCTSSAVARVTISSATGFCPVSIVTTVMGLSLWALYLPIKPSCLRVAWCKDNITSRMMELELCLKQNCHAADERKTLSVWYGEDDWLRKTTCCMSGNVCNCIVFGVFRVDAIFTLIHGHSISFKHMSLLHWWVNVALADILE